MQCNPRAKRSLRLLKSHSCEIGVAIMVARHGGERRAIADCATHGRLRTPQSGRKDLGRQCDRAPQGKNAYQGLRDAYACPGPNTKETFSGAIRNEPLPMGDVLLHVPLLRVFPFGPAIQKTAPICLEILTFGGRTKELGKGSSLRLKRASQVFRCSATANKRKTKGPVQSWP